MHGTSDAMIKGILGMFSIFLIFKLKKKYFMGSANFILSFVQACASGKLSFSECGPFWQLGLIALLLGVVVLILITLITRSEVKPHKAE